MTVGGRGRGLRKGVPHQEVRVEKGQGGGTSGPRAGYPGNTGPGTRFSRAIREGQEAC